MSARKDALTVLKERLEGIATPTFNTDIGQLVFIGEQPVLGTSDPDAFLAIVVAADEPGHNRENVVIVLPVEIQVNIKAADINDVWASIEDVIEDVKTAVETDKDLGRKLLPLGLERGVTRPFDREEGSEYVGVGIEYRLTYTEGWGSP